MPAHLTIAIMLTASVLSHLYEKRRRHAEIGRQHQP